MKTQDTVAGLGAEIETSPNRVLDDVTTLRGGAVISGADTRDITQTNPVYLNAGMPMGRITAKKKYAPSVIGLGEAYTSGQTVITTTLPAAVELVRRVGVSGTFRYRGVSGGVELSQTVTYSAVDTATGIITVTNLAATYAADAWIQAEDGSETVISIYQGENAGFPQRMTEEVNNANVDIRYPVAIAATVLEENVTFWPADGVFRTALRVELKSFGLFIFNDQYTG